MTVNQSSKPERDPAEVYDELFVPALFAQWGPRMAEFAAIERRQRVLDVGCGTGALACAAAERVGPKGRVVGLDPNEQMLAVARRKPTGVTWQLGRAVLCRRGFAPERAAIGRQPCHCRTGDRPELPAVQ